MLKNIITLPLFLTFLIFSMLLNCMGVIILQLSSNHIAYNKLGILEAFKDLPIALVSIIASNYVTKLGYKNSLIISLFFVSVCCLAIPFLEDFWYFKIWFILIGICFSISKISVFSIIKITQDATKLPKVMSITESAFMIGIFMVNIGFGWLLSSNYKEFWKYGFIGIGVIAILNMIILICIPVRQNDDVLTENLTDYKLKKEIYIFLFITFLIVFTEQCFNSWLPTFYKQQLKSHSFFALQANAFFALFSFIGRWVNGKISSKISWLKIAFGCIILIVSLLALSQILLINNKISFIAYLFPFIGFFLSPLYPTYNSKLLSDQPKETVGRLVAYIVFFSSLGSSLGSLMISQVFDQELSFYYASVICIPLLLIAFLTYSNFSIKKIF